MIMQQKNIYRESWNEREEIIVCNKHETNLSIFIQISLRQLPRTGYEIGFCSFFYTCVYVSVEDSYQL